MKLSALAPALNILDERLFIFDREIQIFDADHRSRGIVTP